MNKQIKVPFATFKPMHAEIQKELAQAFEQVLDDSYFIHGKQCQLFEEEFSSY